VEDIIRRLCIYSALWVEAAAALVITCATIEALVHLAPTFVGRGPFGRRRDVWRRLGVWLLLGLEFELAADIIRTAIAPTWTDRATGLDRGHSNLPQLFPRIRHREVANWE
jgi:uncharacterized membrane protein